VEGDGGLKARPDIIPGYPLHFTTSPIHARGKKRAVHEIHQPFLIGIFPGYSTGEQARGLVVFFLMEE
jgi:hypothetical protein